MLTLKDFGTSLTFAISSPECHSDQLCQRYLLVVVEKQRRSRAGMEAQQLEAEAQQSWDEGG